MKALESCVEKLITEWSVGNIIVKVGCGEETLLDVRRSAEGKVLTDRRCSMRRDLHAAVKRDLGL